MYQVCDFRAEPSTETAVLASGPSDIFDFSHATLNGIWQNLTGNKYSTSSTKFVFIGPFCCSSRPSLWLTDTFTISLMQPWTELTKLGMKQDLVPSLCSSGRSTKGGWWHPATQAYNIWWFSIPFSSTVYLLIVIKMLHLSRFVPHVLSSLSIYRRYLVMDHGLF